MLRMARKSRDGYLDNNNFAKIGNLLNLVLKSTPVLLSHIYFLAFFILWSLTEWENIMRDSIIVIASCFLLVMLEFIAMQIIDVYFYTSKVDPRHINNNQDDESFSKIF